MTADDYLGQFSGEVRDWLDAVRDIITTNILDAVESVSYGLVGYKLHGKPLVYFGGFAHHVGLYSTPTGHEAFSEELAGYKRGKDSVQFPHNQPLPTALIRRIVSYRAQQIKGRSAQ